MEQINDPSLYRRMSEPFPDMKTTQAALDAFAEEVRVSREKHKIPDVVLITQFSWIGANGEECAAMAYGNNGNPQNNEAMLAHALGLCQAERQELIGQLLTKGLRRGAKK